MPNLNVVTFNIAHGRGLSLYQGFSSQRRLERNLTAIAEMLESTDADVVALQEIDEDSHWNKNINMVDFLEARTSYRHCLMGINNERSGPKPLKYGNAILSKHPVKGWFNQPFGSASLGEKGFMYAELDVGDHVVCVVNLHLDYRSREKRIVQVEKLIDFLRNRPHPGKVEERVAPIVCGDFNSHSQRAGDAVRHLFDYLLTHADYALYPEKTRTFPAHWPRRGIDFIFLPRNYRMKRCEVLRSFLSDHRPVLLEFEF